MTNILLIYLWRRRRILTTYRDVNVFIFQKNDRFVMKTTTKNRKRNERFFKKFVFLKWWFLKRSFFKTFVFQNDRFSIVFIKFVVSLTIVNDEPSLATDLR